MADSNLNDNNQNKTIKTPQRLKGFNDFFSKDARLRQFVSSVFIETFEKT